MQLQNLSWPEIEKLTRDIPVLIPIAAIEQHGNHLPVSTDSDLLGEIVARTEATMGSSFLSLPLQWLGNSHHHLDFPGTLSCSPRTYLDMVGGIVDNMLQHGFRRILILNGHGGNDVPGRQVTFEVRQKYRERDELLLLFSTYWQLAGPPANTVPQLQQTEMGHACEWETSMMLAISPEHVGDYLSAEPLDPGVGFSPAERAWRTKQRTAEGHIGFPAQATLEKGLALLEHFSCGVTKTIQKMQSWDGQSWNAQSNA